MYFCIRDDDTSFFTSPEDLERSYGKIKSVGPVSLAIIPFCLAGSSKAVPEKFRNRWTIHPLDQNRSLVSYLRLEIAAGRFEAMLHGYYHETRSLKPEFVSGDDLMSKVRDGRKYLEDVLETRIAVFVPPHNRIGRRGLSAIESADRTSVERQVCEGAGDLGPPTLGRYGRDSNDGLTTAGLEFLGCSI